MTLHIEVPTGQLEAIRSRLTLTIHAARQRLVQEAAQAVITQVANSVPVETGETRDAWQAEGSRVAATPPAATGHSSSLSASVSVDQMLYIEYGTSRMQPQAPVRNALADVQPLLSSMFRLE